jgi:hypothetical protein
MTHPQLPAWTRSLAWLALPLVVVALLVMTRKGGRGPAEPWLDPAAGKVAAAGAADPAVAGLARRMHQKQHIVDTVRERRRSLFEAAAMFRALDQDPPAPGWSPYYLRHPGSTAEERYCRQVIAWVEATVVYEQGKDDGTVARLRGELEEVLRDGPPSLPELPDLFVRTRGE